MQQLCVVLGSERGLSGGGSRVSGEGGCLHSVSLRLALSQRERPARAVYRIVTVLFWYINVGVYHQGPPHALVSACVRLCPLINTPLFISPLLPKLADGAVLRVRCWR